MSSFEIATLAQNQWLVWLSGGALLLNSIATGFALLGVRYALRQSEIQKSVLKQQILSAEAELIRRELENINIASGIAQQERATALTGRLEEIYSELRLIFSEWK